MKNDNIIRSYILPNKISFKKKILRIKLYNISGRRIVNREKTKDKHTYYYHNKKSMNSFQRSESKMIKKNNTNEIKCRTYHVSTRVRLIKMSYYKIRFQWDFF